MRTPSASRGVNARLSTQFVTAFRQGLKEAGFVEGQNVAIDYRWADNQLDRTPALVAELISRPVAVIVGNNATAFAAKAATKTVPIVFAYGSDPVQDGLVASLNRPGDNLTGVVFFAALGAKRLELLHRLVPNVTTIGLLVNPNTPETEAERKDVQAAAEAIGQQLIVVEVNSDREVEPAFATFVQRGAGALLIGTGRSYSPTGTNSSRWQPAMRYRPAISCANLLLTVA